MPNNVYIGSRYVPIFDGEWSSTKNYEGLTIVTYNGSSYTSKGPVPAGTLPTNNTYWALTGNYNGQISNLQQQIDDIEDITIPAIQTQIDDIKDTTIPAIQTQIDDINIDIATAPKIICIGDSYLNGDQVSSWGAHLRDLIGNGDDTIIKGYGGSGFIGQQPSHTYLIQLQEVVGDLSPSQRTEITDIVVIGGLNDKAIYTQSPPLTDNDLITAITNFVTYAHTNFVNAKIRIGIVGWATDGLSDKGYWDNMFNCFKKCAVNGFGKYVQFMSGLEYIMPSIPNSGYSDSVHPNSATSKIIARGILNCMNNSGGDMGLSYTETPITVNWWSGTTNQSINARFSLYGNIAQIKLNTIQWDYSPAISYTFNTELAFAVVNADLPIRASTIIRIPATFWINDGTGNPKQLGGYIAIDGRYVKVYIDAPIAGITNITRIWARCSSYSDSVFNIC